LTTGGTISFSKRPFLYVVRFRVSVGRHPSLFLTFSCLLVSFRVSFYAVVCECYDTSLFTSRSPTDKNTKHAQMTYTCGHILRNNTNSTNANQR